MAGINFDFTTGVLPGAITFTRASIGTYNSSGNILTTASNDAARFNYISGVANLLIEGSATNMLVQSNSFLTTWYSTNGCVPVAAQFVSPDGTNNGWSFPDNSNFGWLFQDLATVVTPYTLSMWVKTITGAAIIQFNVTGASLGITPTGTLTRRLATQTPTGAGTNINFRMQSNNASVNGMYGAQLETGSVMTSYIPTTTAAVTRAADSATFTIPAGVNALLYTFDDGSTQQVSVTPGSYTIPVTLNRPNIKSIVGVQTGQSTVQLGRFQTLALTANTPVQITAGGTYRLAILNTGPGNLYVSTTATPGANAQSMLIPPLKMAPYATTAATIWIAADQAGGVSIAMMPR